MKLILKITKIVAETARIIVGLTFVFSGFVKTVDPLGSAYKIQDYLIAFHLPSLFAWALPLAIFLCVVEMSIGFFILLGVYRKWTSRALILFMLVMLPVTLYLALKNPVKDCGCFGDAFIISNWETFYKNVFLSVCAILIVIFWKHLTPFYSKKTAKYVAFFIVLFGVLFAVYNVINRPIIDFRPYKIGANIPQMMHEDAANGALFENVFVYEKNGKKEEFSEENYPWQDSTWTFVEMKTKMIKDGKAPRIEDFDINLLQKNDSTYTWSEGRDITDQILSNPSHTLLLICYKLPEMNDNILSKLNAIHSFALQNNIDFYCLTASGIAKIEDWEKRYTTDFLFCHADERTLKTIVRSNPGLVWMKNGTIINKWDKNSIPDADTILTKPKTTNRGYRLLFDFLLIIVPLLLFKIWDRRQNKQAI